MHAGVYFHKSGFKYSVSIRVSLEGGSFTDKLVLQQMLFSNKLSATL